MQGNHGAREVIGERGRNQQSVPIDFTYQLAHSTAQSKPGHTRTIHNFYISKSKSFMQPDTGRFQERFLHREHGGKSGMATSPHSAFGQFTWSENRLQRAVGPIGSAANTVDRHDIYTECLRRTIIHSVVSRVQRGVGAACSLRDNTSIISRVIFVKSY